MYYTLQIILLTLNKYNSGSRMVGRYGVTHIQ
jgi:hypothetical protein